YRDFWRRCGSSVRRSAAGGRLNTEFAEIGTQRSQRRKTRTGISMLLTIDVGNTNTVLGVFRGEELVANWRLTTARQQTVDEYGVLTRNLFTLADLDRDAINGVIISSVVPPVNWTLGEMSRLYFGKK